jgi:seryl-tRNA synthetase
MVTVLDIKFIRENPKEVKEICNKRNINLNIDELISLDNEFRNIKKRIDDLRQLKNSLNGPKNSQKIKVLKEDLKKLELKFKSITNKRNYYLDRIPNILSDDVPIGLDEKDNIEIYKYNEKKIFNFIPLIHDELCVKKDILDIKQGSKVSGNGFYYWKNKGAIVLRALINYAIDFLLEKNFELMFTPILTRKKSLYGTGFIPFISDENYKIEDEDLNLIGTSEQTLISYNMDKLLKEKDLPILYTAYTPCFRTESGSYGKESRGIFRVHQFNKVEQICFCKPEDSEKYFDFLIKNSIDFMKSLDLHFRVVNVCSGDLGAPAFKKYDIESWFPGFKAYRETHSGSNILDFQSRRLNIKYLKNDLFIYPHTLNCTLVTDRTLLAIIEQNQTEDGRILVPEPLKKYLNFNYF